MYDGIAEHMIPWLKDSYAPPYRIHIYPTDRCNLRCVSCWRWDFKDISNDGTPPWVTDELSDDKLLSIIDEGNSLGVKEWELSGGGEPFVRKKTVLEMIKKIKKAGKRGTITTNGTLFTPELVEFLVDIGWDYIVFSLDGPVSEVNDYLRPPAGSFDRTVNTLRLFRDCKKRFNKNKPDITIFYVLSNKNVSHIVPMIKLAAECGIRDINFEPVKMLSPRCKELLMTDSDHKFLKAVSQEAREIASKNNISTNIPSLISQPQLVKEANKLTNFIENSVSGEFSYKHPLLSACCYEPWYRMFISSMGTVAPCCLATYFQEENVKNKSLKEIWLGKNFTDFREKILAKTLPPSCNRCNAVLFSHSKWIQGELRKASEDVSFKSDIEKKPDVYVSTNSQALSICLVSREYPPDTGWGGIGTYTYHLAHGLAERGHNVHVISQAFNGDTHVLDGKVNVHRINHKGFFFHNGPFKEFSLRLEYSRTVSLKLREIIKKYKIDIVEAPNLSGEGFIYSLARKTPLVTRLHTHSSEAMNFYGVPRTMDSGLSCLLEDTAIKRSNLVTCSTNGHAALVADEAGIDKSRIKIIPLGIPLLPLEDVKPIEHERPMILFVGRLEKRKGPQVLAEAIPAVLKEVPDAEFVFIGRDTFFSKGCASISGENKHSFKKVILDKMLSPCIKNVKFIGYVEPEELRRYFRSCDVFAAPSLYESFGFIYIEAMSYGKPVIGCSVGGVPEVVKNEVNGILVPPEDPAALASATIDLLKHKDKRAELGRAARKTVEDNFSRELMVERTEKAYRELL